MTSIRPVGDHSYSAAPQIYDFSAILSANFGRLPAAKTVANSSPAPSKKYLNASYNQLNSMKIFSDMDFTHYLCVTEEENGL